MAKNNKKYYEEKRKEAFNTKYFFIKYAKRYGITLLISAPIILILSYILSTSLSWYTGSVAFFCGFAMLLFAILIGMVVFSKIDDRKKEKETPEKESDPFAD